MNHQNIKAGRALKGKNGFAFRSASDTRIFNICHILSSGMVTHLDQDPFIIQLQLNYRGSSQTKSTLKMGLKKTMLQGSSEVCALLRAEQTELTVRRCWAACGCSYHSSLGFKGTYCRHGDAFWGYLKTELRE